MSDLTLTKLTYGVLMLLLSKINQKTQTADRKVWAYYHKLGVVTFELMPAGPNSDYNWIGQLNTVVGGRRFMEWVDLDVNPLESVVRRQCLKFLKACTNGNQKR